MQYILNSSISITIVGDTRINQLEIQRVLQKLFKNDNFKFVYNFNYYYTTRLKKITGILVSLEIILF